MKKFFNIIGWLIVLLIATIVISFISNLLDKYHLEPKIYWGILGAYGVGFLASLFMSKYKPKRTIIRESTIKSNKMAVVISLIASPIMLIIILLTPFILIYCKIKGCEDGY